MIRLSLIAALVLAAPAAAQLTVDKPSLVVPAPAPPANPRAMSQTTKAKAAAPAAIAPAAPMALAPGQAGILVAFRRPDKASEGKSGALAFARYDPEKRDLIPEPRGAKKQGITTTYNVLARSTDRRAPIEHALFLVTPGDYVLAGASPGPGGMVVNSFCLSGPTFRVTEGEIAYFGAITPYMSVKQVDGTSVAAMAWSSDVEAARAALADHPALQQAVQPADIRNKATWGCVATTMMAYDVPGAPILPAAGDLPPEAQPDAIAPDAVAPDPTG